MSEHLSKFEAAIEQAAAAAPEWAERLRAWGADENNRRRGILPLIPGIDFPLESRTKVRGQSLAVVWEDADRLVCEEAVESYAVYRLRRGGRREHLGTYTIPHNLDAQELRERVAQEVFGIEPRWGF